jgi:S-adenosylmethionine-diacylglycerol 3-amino-3-carboxypropyl transferase
MGRFERMLQTLARVNGVISGERGRQLFESDDLDAQRHYMATRFPVRAWKLVIALLGNSTVLNSLLYRGAFPKKTLPASTYAIYSDIFNRLFTNVLARRSFFLQMVFFGELRYRDGFPIECSPEVYSAAQQSARLNAIEFVHGDIVEYVRQCGGAGFVSLSDVPSFLHGDRSRAFLGAMQPGLLPGALVVSRGHLRIVAPDTRGFDDRSSEFADCIATETTQLWRVNIYQKARDAGDARLETNRGPAYN